jgi:hypothetical protein
MKHETNARIVPLVVPRKHAGKMPPDGGILTAAVRYAVRSK